MVLSEKQRHTIYEHLAPQWGEDVTQAFLSHFPAREGDEPVTRDYLRAEMAELRGELRGEMAELRGELRAEIKGMGSKLAGLVIGVGAIVITAMGIATTVIVTLS